MTSYLHVLLLIIIRFNKLYSMTKQNKKKITTNSVKDSHYIGHYKEAADFAKNNQFIN